MTDLGPILERLATVLERPPLPPDRILWDAARVGEYLGVAPRTVAEKWAHRPGFPKAIALGGERALRRWKAKEVMDWAERQREG